MQTSKKKNTSKEPQKPPEEAEWLLNFVNIGKEPGRLDFTSRKKPKRLAVPPLNARPVGGTLTKRTFQGEVISEESFPFLTDGKNLWDARTKEPLGSAGDGEFQEDLLAFFGLKPLNLQEWGDNEEEYGRLSLLWLQIRYAFEKLIRGGFNLAWVETCKATSGYNNKIRLDASGEIFFNYPKKSEVGTAKTLTSFLNFMLNQKELHALLRLCPYCGRFFFKEKKPGRPQIFCDPECEDVFNNLPKEEKTKLMQGYRAHNKRIRQNKEYNEIMQMLVRAGKTETEAKKEANDWIYIKRKTLKQYINFYEPLEEMS